MSNNVQVEQKGNKLVITVDVSPATIKEAPMSSSGKNKLIASTCGMQPVNGTGIKLGLNVITK
jgi:hypothetical protein